MFYRRVSRKSVDSDYSCLAPWVRWISSAEWDFSSIEMQAVWGWFRIPSSGWPEETGELKMRLASSLEQVEQARSVADVNWGDGSKDVETSRIYNYIQLYRISWNYIILWGWTSMKTTFFSARKRNDATKYLFKKPRFYVTSPCFPCTVMTCSKSQKLHSFFCSISRRLDI